MAAVPAKDLMTTATSDEMMELAEGQELFSSNLFRLQLAELLSEVRINYKKAKRTNKLLHGLKDTLEGLSSCEVCTAPSLPASSQGHSTLLLCQLSVNAMCMPSLTAGHH